MKSRIFGIINKFVKMWQDVEGFVMDVQKIGELLVNLVRVAIFDELYNKHTLNKEEFLEKFPNFNKNAATFVTLTINGHLRGCIGSLVPHTTLYNDLTTNAKKAAFEDPRFNPLSQEEFDNIKVEISLISPITEVKYKDFKDLKSKIKPNIHGVILKLGSFQSTFLPQVWEEIPDFDMFMYHLYKKAGLEMIEQNQAPQIFTYTVEKIQEQ